MVDISRIIRLLLNRGVRWAMLARIWVTQASGNTIDIAIVEDRYDFFFQQAIRLFCYLQHPN